MQARKLSLKTLHLRSEKTWIWFFLCLNPAWTGQWAILDWEWGCPQDLMLQLLIMYKILRIIRGRNSKRPALPCWLQQALWHGTVGFKPLLQGLILLYKKKRNRINKREWGRLLRLGPLLGDVASNALWHMGKPNLDNLHQPLCSRMSMACLITCISSDLHCLCVLLSVTWNVNWIN